MKDFDSGAVTKTCNGLYHQIFNGLGLLVPSARIRYFDCIDLENGHDYFKTTVDSYEFHYTKLRELREQINEALHKPWIWEVINRAIPYCGNSPTGHATFVDEAKERLLRFEGLYRRLWENLTCTETLRSHAEKVNEDRRIWREFEQDRNFASLTTGLQDELAAIKQVISDQGNELVALAESAKPFDWSTALQGANEQQERKTQELKTFHENQEVRMKWQRLDDAMMNWRHTWDNAALSRSGQLLGDFDPITELTRSLDELREAIDSVGYSSNLAKVERLFDPSCYDERDARKEAFALKTVLQMLVGIKNGHDAKQLVTELWSFEPLRDCRTCFALKDILRRADNWPLICTECNKQLEPSRFGFGTCNSCNEAKQSIVGKSTDDTAGELHVFGIDQPIEAEKIRTVELQELCKENPLIMNGTTWMQRKSIATKFGYDVGSLRTSASGGEKFVDRSGGIDRGGRLWKSNPSDSDDIWYLVSTVTMNNRNAKTVTQKKAGKNC